MPRPLLHALWILLGCSVLAWTLQRLQTGRAARRLLRYSLETQGFTRVRLSRTCSWSHPFQPANPYRFRTFRLTALAPDGSRRTGWARIAPPPFELDIRWDSDATPSAPGEAEVLAVLPPPTAPAGDNLHQGTQDQSLP